MWVWEVFCWIWLRVEEWSGLSVTNWEVLTSLHRDENVRGDFHQIGNGLRGVAFCLWQLEKGSENNDLAIWIDFKAFEAAHLQAWETHKRCWHLAEKKKRSAQFDVLLREFWQNLGIIPALWLYGNLLTGIRLGSHALTELRDISKLFWCHQKNLINNLISDSESPWS